MMIANYKGRIIKHGLDYILDREGENGIDRAISARSSLRNPITREECIEYLNYRRAIQCLDVCRTGWAYEIISVGKHQYARDIDHNAYISYTDLCQAIPSHISLEDYGEAILSRALVDTFVDRNQGTHMLSLYCPATFLAKHFILSGCQDKNQETFLEIMTILERIPAVVRVEDAIDGGDWVYPKICVNEQGVAKGK